MVKYYKFAKYWLKTSLLLVCCKQWKVSFSRFLRQSDEQLSELVSTTNNSSPRVHNKAHIKYFYLLVYFANIQLYASMFTNNNVNVVSLLADDGSD